VRGSNMQESTSAPRYGLEECLFVFSVVLVVTSGLLLCGCEGRQSMSQSREGSAEAIDKTGSDESGRLLGPPNELIAVGKSRLTETGQLLSSLDASDFVAIEIEGWGYATNSHEEPTYADRLRLAREFIAGRLEDKRRKMRCVVRDLDAIAGLIGVMQKWTHVSWHGRSPYGMYGTPQYSMRIVLLGKKGVESVEMLVEEVGGIILTRADEVYIRYLSNSEAVNVGWAHLTATHDRGVVFADDAVFKAIYTRMLLDREWKTKANSRR